ncbi:putative helicase mov-10-B.1 [Pseudoliparis swirei]|uniref:putative helicase mov-10-B.1 n=1 Tax=Pseudoliparis swirei TaxID=2059687 RepID=UPI0024BE07ED|nr:putative helicase mov-10-B.1 [Pseudoliparis swirei]
MSVKDSLESGLDFVEFLGDRISITSKKELREIYNAEFKGREGIKDPTFSSVLHALLKCNKAHVKQGAVYINVGPQFRVYCDQWRKPRAPQTPHSPDTGPQETDETPSSSPSSSPSSAPSTNMKSVLNPKKKMATEILSKLKMKRKKLTADKWGIVITSDPPAREGRIHVTVDRLRESFALPFHILNKGTHCVQFTFYTALHKIRCFTLEDEKSVDRASPLILRPGESYGVVVRYTLNHYGYFPTTMYFEFCPVLPKAVPFCIMREMEVVARTPLALELGPVAPYRPFQVVTYRPVKTVTVEGIPPPGSGSRPLKMAVKLRNNTYPAYLKQLAKQRMENSVFLSPAARQKLPSVKGLLNSSLAMKTYAQRLHLLLHLEEIQTEVDIRKYDLRNQVFTRDQCNKKLLTFRAPGVAENRPSVLRGDCIRVSNSAEKVEPITVYIGYVHRVELDSVTLGFSKRLLFSSDMKFDVEFTLNRYCLNLQHRAVDLAEKHKLEKVLFPTGAAVAYLSMPKLRMFNEQLENNPEQRAAVQRIVAGSSKPAPHLVFGPPGTGKTITLVEAMHQVSKADPSARILACAPSNSACDLLCERLMVHTDASRICRVYASSRDPRSIPKNMLKYCNWKQDKRVLESPLKETLMKYLIVVTTLVTAGKLVTIGIPVGHFTHVFLDEGGHAVESECVIPIAGLLSAETGQLVLAGDPKQLGPILRSPFSLQYGLGLSLLERLMKHNALYQKSTESGHFDTRFVTKLLRNYRSHPAILKIPNELFYENELQAFADPWERDTYCNWEHLPKKGFPLIFHGVMGKDEREANSPSFFNVSEIEVVVDYLTKLMDTQGKKGLPKLCAKDIGIISPYRKQVEKIQKALKSVAALKRWGDLKELKVGSVEEFQGQERKIIMVSTVRSSLNYVRMDKDFNIGFLSNEKRFNVALTRARSLLIVVGNPVILNKDPTWEKLIRYCVKEEGYAGFDFEDAEGEDDLVSSLTSLNINVDSDEPVEEGEESALQRQPGPSEDMNINV